MTAAPTPARPAGRRSERQPHPGASREKSPGEPPLFTRGVAPPAADLEGRRVADQLSGSVGTSSLRSAGIRFHWTASPEPPAMGPKLKARSASMSGSSNPAP